MPRNFWKFSFFLNRKYRSQDICIFFSLDFWRMNTWNDLELTEIKFLNFLKLLSDEIKKFQFLEFLDTRPEVSFPSTLTLEKWTNNKMRLTGNLILLLHSALLSELHRRWKRSFHYFTTMKSLLVLSKWRIAQAKILQESDCIFSSKIIPGAQKFLEIFIFFE